MHVVSIAAYLNGVAFQAFADASKVFIEAFFDRFVNLVGSVFCAEHDVYVHF